MELQQGPDDLLEACPPWLNLGPDADWLGTDLSNSEPASSGRLETAAETSDLSADTQERCLWTLAVVDSQTGRALRPVTPAEAQAVWVPQPTAQTSVLLRGESFPEPLPVEALAERGSSEEGSCPPSPGLPTSEFGCLDRQLSVASQLSKIGGPCQHCGVKESPQWRRGPVNKPILCNACGTRYRRTHQFKHAVEGGLEGLPRANSTGSWQGPRMESPESSLGTRSGSLGPRSPSLPLRANSTKGPTQRSTRKQSRGLAGTRLSRKRALADIAQ